MMEIIKPGLYTTVQDYPGRVGYWDIGIPPSGPMDSLAFRVANCLVGNPEGAAGLEITAIGPVIRFENETRVAYGSRVRMMKAGEILDLTKVDGGGFRSYLAVAGGIDVPDYLGSKSTFPFGQFGGFEGRPLKAGDRLKIGESTSDYSGIVPKGLMPDYKNQWEIDVLPGPHGSPDYFTEESEEMFYATDWKAHYQSNRLGYRLIGPEPTFARENGGEGGRHPSNLHDYVYSIGSVNFTGNLPIVLTQDGPSLGGFVCLATIITADLWKMGQVRPNDTIRFVRVSLEGALEKRSKIEELLAKI